MSHSCTGVLQELFIHQAARKCRREGKAQILHMLLSRGADVAARDWEGSSPRDYLFVFDVPDADQLQQIIDDHVVEMIYNDQWYRWATNKLNLRKTNT